MNCPPRHTFRTVFPVLALCRPAVFFDGMDVNIYGAVPPHMLDYPSLGPTPAHRRHHRQRDHVRHAHGRTHRRKLSDDATREGAYEQTAQGGRPMPPRPATPTRQTVRSLLEQSPAAKSH
jgi:hypothetical protein